MQTQNGSQPDVKPTEFKCASCGAVVPLPPELRGDPMPEGEMCETCGAQDAGVWNYKEGRVMTGVETRAERTGELEEGAGERSFEEWEEDQADLRAAREDRNAYFSEVA